jgi:tetratricopeptide (TPR) repeat protein
MSAAANLLGRAASLLPLDSNERVELLPTLAAALAEVGRLLDARAVLAAAVEVAVATGNPRVEWRARAADGWWRLNMDAEVQRGEFVDLARRAVAELEALGDDFGLAIAWRLESDLANVIGDGARWIEGLRRAFEHARRGANRHEEWACLSILGGALFFGPTPVGEAVAELEALREDLGGDLMIERSRAIQSELGLEWGLAAIPFMSGRVARLSGDLATAEREYRASAQAYTEMGERGRLPTVVAQLAAVAYEFGRLDDALQLADEAEALAGAQDVMSHVGARLVRARALARQDDIVEAERLARESLGLVEATDFLDDHALALLDLAEVLELAGRPQESLPIVERAVTLTRQKGNVLLERRASERLSRLRTAERE